jgi:phage tail sheath gpL-like
VTFAFTGIPSNLLVPGNYTEVNGNRATSDTPELPRRMTLIGSRLTTGAVATSVPYRCSSAADAEYAAGVGSPVAEMAAVVKAAYPSLELYVIGVTDDASGVAATATITVTVSSNLAGTISLYVAPYWVGSTLRGKYSVACAAGDTVTTIAEAIVAAVNADPYRTVQATNLVGVVTLTARNDGTQGNSLKCLHSYFVGEKLPTGVSLAITDFASGATNPSISAAIAAMGDGHSSHLVSQWTDATSMTALETEMTRRWGPTVQRECHLFTASSGSLGTLTTLGDSRNSELSTCLGSGLSPIPSWIAAAGVAVTHALEPHPGRPLRGRPIDCMLAPVMGDEFEASERQQLLAEGISTYTVDSSGKCRIERLVTTYQEDVNGNPDSKYRDIQVMFLLAAIRYDWRTYVGAKYPDFMHAADGTSYAPGLAIITPSTMRAEFAGRATNVWAYSQGWIEDPEQFADDIEIERTEDGMDLIGVPNLINRLHITKTRLDFLR